MPGEMDGLRPERAAPGPVQQRQRPAAVGRGHHSLAGGGHVEHPVSVQVEELEVDGRGLGRDGQRRPQPALPGTPALIASAIAAADSE